MAMGMEGGLAAQAQQQQSAEAVSVDQVAAMLMQGMKPEDLLRQGIPMEVIRQAAEMVIQQQESMQAPQPTARPQTEAGLSSMAPGM